MLQNQNKKDRSIFNRSVIKLQGFTCTLEEQATISRCSSRIANSFVCYKTECMSRQNFVQNKIELRFPSSLVNLTHSCLLENKPQKQQSDYQGFFKSIISSSANHQHKDASQGKQYPVSKRKKERQTGKNERGDKKNVVKNLVSAFGNYLDSLIRKQQKIEQHASQLAKLIQRIKFNNRLITSIVDDQNLRQLFRIFLGEPAAQWVRYSKIKNKEVHTNAIVFYSQLCQDKMNQLLQDPQFNSSKDSKIHRQRIFQNQENDSFEAQIKNILK